LELYQLSYLWLSTNLHRYICIFISKIQLICHVTTFDVPLVTIQDHLKQIIIMDDVYQYFKKSWKIFIVPHVKLWWMDEKWRQHDIMVVVIWELHNSWKAVVTKLQLSCNELHHIYGELQLLQLSNNIHSV
jgi:hypothetical protein